MGCLFFTDERVVDYDPARHCDTASYARYFHAMLEQGVYLAPSQFEAYFFSTRHGDAELERTLLAQYRALEILRDGQSS
jgi:glutamate-1-semialdehyde 2,1-aminomutase